MTITTLYKDVDRQTLTIHGHLSKQEIASFKRDGWRYKQPNVNKIGIPVHIQKPRRK
ncbi:hypothetical protein [Paenisporosarcina sp. OV554]|uniref:hypothetical protein n=1 Tax=Paenisporosarcina sp. OV554 TaxID=2135694 RepID=UPI000D45F5A0|nr:hypothetical protein [Paenisporosarcina sp. OV554]PUB12598.1 hypothetical protein C8K15_10997 [Paenisporosarcina sp. OV554]